MSVPESHRVLLAALEGRGLHLHEERPTVWKTVGMAPRQQHRKLCGSDRCFLIKIRNVQPEEQPA